MMTAQEIFETSAIGVIKQGKRAADGDNCLYRTPEGDKCAAGHLIPDDVYDSRMENKVIEMLAHHYPRIPQYFKDNKLLLCKLQKVHDFSHKFDVDFHIDCGLAEVATELSTLPFLENFINGVRRIAADHNLDMTKVEEAYALRGK